MTPRLAAFLRALIQRVKLSPATLAGVQKNLRWFAQRAPYVVFGWGLCLVVLGNSHPRVKPALMKLPQAIAKKTCKPCAAKRAATKQDSVPLRPEPDPISAAKSKEAP